MAQLGKYQLVAEIARGGMGIVYLAVARGPARFSKLLVVKQLKPELSEDATFLEMFLEEARLAARLNHPNIVQTIEVDSDDGRHFMVMDYLNGITLARILRRKDPRFTLALQLRVICEVLHGLHYAHTVANFDGTPLGVVHRDATPQNVFVTFDGQVKLVDFGIAKALDSTVETSTGVLKGKPSYMAPEQIAGDTDPRADVFTLGVVLWEAIAGRRMWEKKKDVEILTNIIKGEVPSLRQAVPDVDPELLRITEKAIAKSKDDRYASAADFQTDLEAYIAKLGTPTMPRDIAKVVGEMFAQDRANTKQLIDKHLARLESGAADSVKPPSLRPPRDPSSSSTSEISLASQVGTPLSSLTPGLGQTPPGTEIPIPAPASNGKRGFLIGVGVVAVLAVGAIVGKSAFGPKPDTGTATTAVAEPKQTPPATTPGNVAVDSSTLAHEVSLRAFPKNAVITIDGAEVSNPVTRSCSTGKPINVHASAPGLVSADRQIKCDRDESIEIALTAQPTPNAPVWTSKPTSKPIAAAQPPSPATPGAPPAAPSPAAPKPPPTEVNPNGGVKPNRTVDTSNPYN